MTAARITELLARSFLWVALGWLAVVSAVWIQGRS